MKLLHKKELEELGYTLHSFSGDYSTGSYYNEAGVFVDVHRDGTVELSYTWKLLVIKTPKISFPNKNFSVFENMVLKASYRLGEE